MSEINSRTERRKRGTEPQNERKKPKGIIKKFAATVAILFVLVLAGGAALFAYYASTAPDLDEELLKDPLTSNFLTKDGEIFLKFGTEKRDFIPYAEIPERMKDAILATEDVRFFKHNGIDFYRLGGAVLANLRGGFGSQGASTLTQQVIKNSFLTDEKTLKRKAQEAWLAYKLEKEYTKEEIFEMYFNKILMSGNRYGFGTGANYFYGKKLNELDLSEMAMLAGMPQYPNGYNPFKYPERAEKRRNVVLTLMNRHGKITDSQMNEAKSKSITATLLPEDQRETFSKYPAYVDAVLDEIEEAGLSDLLAEGVTVQTALDPKVQETVENTINNPNYYESKEMQVGMTVLETQTSAIVAIGGGRDYSGRNLNFSSQKRQPGSVIKPILSYGPAIEEFSWSTGQRVVDQPYKYKGTNISINNVDGRYLGNLTLRQALYYSRNIPAVKVFEEVGTKDAKAFAGKLGLTYGDINSSDALGGGAHEFSTVDMAGAYAAFGNGGIYTKPHTVTKITMRDGKSVRNMRPDPVTAMKDSTAYMVTDMLRDVLTEGTAKLAQISGMDIAGKTGTTNYSAKTIAKYGLKNSDVPDTWFTGYTTEYTISTWGGYADYVTPVSTYDYGRYVPQKLFKSVMGAIASNPDSFEKPDSVEEANIIRGTNPIVLAGPFTTGSHVSKELFVKGSEPKKQAVPEKVTIPSPTGLSARFDGSNSVQLSWNYDTSSKYSSLGSPSFNVSVSVNGGAAQHITTTSGMSASYSGASYGSSYTFYVTANVGGYRSGSATATLSLAGSSQNSGTEDKDEDGDSEIETPDDNQHEGNNRPDDDGENDSGDDNNNENDNSSQDNQGNSNPQGNQNNQNGQNQDKPNEQGGQNNQNQGNPNSEGNQGSQETPPATQGGTPPPETEASE